MSTKAKGDWDWEIQAKTNYLGVSFKELWSYRHLLANLVRRDFLLNYQQTVLGPVWIVIQPIFTLVTFLVVFYKLVGISTGSVPAVLFYFSGIVLWNFFAESFGSTSNTFRENAQVFSKVYFPRIIMPLSVLSTHFLRFLVQLLLLGLGILYYWLFLDFRPVQYNWFFAFPIAIFFVGVIGLSMGLIFSVLTGKYRDMLNFVALGLRLTMFITPVIYPVSFIQEKARWLVHLNPLSPLFELFRLSLLGEGTFTSNQLIYSLVFSVVILLGALLMFNKQGDKLIDVV